MNFKFEFQVWISSLIFNFEFQVWISNLNFEFEFQGWIPSSNSKFELQVVKNYVPPARACWFLNKSEIYSFCHRLFGPQSWPPAPASWFLIKIEFHSDLKPHSYYTTIICILISKQKWNFRFECQVWISSLNFKFGFQVWISSLIFKSDFQVWISNLNFGPQSWSPAPASWFLNMFFLIWNPILTTQRKSASWCLNKSEISSLNFKFDFQVWIWSLNFKFELQVSKKSVA